MTDEDETVWPLAPWTQQFQQAGEQAMEQQAELAKQLFAMGGGPSGLDGGFGQLGAMSRTMATFKTRVQSGGRISIPDAERDALDINEGDIVQTIVIPVKRQRDTNE